MGVVSEVMHHLVIFELFCHNPEFSWNFLPSQVFTAKNRHVLATLKFRKFLESMVYYDQILHINACQHYLIIGMCNSLC